MNGQSIWDVNKKQDFPTIEDILKAEGLTKSNNYKKNAVTKI